jgi:hypothetical protein
VLCSKNVAAKAPPRDPVRKAWHGIMRRCSNPRDPYFHIYGGRGITVCDRWKESFEAFASDMGPKPSRRHSIDRIDNNGNYEPNNCRWALPSEQSRNTRRNVNITHRGRTMAAVDWATQAGVSKSLIHWRTKNGRPIVDILDRALDRLRATEKP